MRLGLTVLLRSDPDFPQFNIALNQSLKGDASLFAYQPLFDIRETVVSPLFCSDFRRRSSHFPVSTLLIATCPEFTDEQKTFEGFNALTVNAQSVRRHTPTWNYHLISVSLLE